MYLYGLTGLRLSCPPAVATAALRLLPPPPRPTEFFFLKKKKVGLFGYVGVLLGCSLAGFVVCGFASVACLGILPKVACHGDDGR